MIELYSLHLHTAILSGMAAEIDFQPYLHSISTHYDHWWELYTLTDAEETQANQRNEPQPWKTPFDFGWMVGRLGSGKSTTLAQLLLEEARGLSSLGDRISRRHE